MKSKQNLVLLAALSALFNPSVTLAQPVSLKEATQQAVLTNPEVLSRWHAYQASIGERDVASGALRPSVDLTLGGGLERRDDPILTRNYGRLSGSVSLTQMLYDGFAARNEIRRLDHARMVRLFELQEASEAAALEAANAFVDVQRFRKLVSLAEDNYVQHRSVFDQIERKVQAGVGRKVDLEQASGRLALAESNLLIETSNLHDVSARYQRLVGAPAPKDLAGLPSLSKDIPSDATSAVAQAQANNPTLRAAIENTLSANAALDGRDAAFRPRVDFRLRHDQGENVSGLDGANRNDVAEVVVTYNLYHGGSDSARVRQYTDLRDSARDLRDKTCRDIRQTLVIAYNDVRKLNEQLNYLDQHQLSIEKARDAYRKQFDIGQRTLLDLLDTENELFQARRAYTIAEHDSVAAYIRTHAAMGTLLTALDLTRVGQDEAAMAGSWNSDGEAAQSCPVEAPTLYVTDKDALNARAQEVLKASLAVQAAAARAAEQAVDSTRSKPEVTPSTAPASAVPDSKIIEAALAVWKQAWAERNLSAYLGQYAPGFVPADGITREEWARKRGESLKRARDVSLDIGELKVNLLDANHAETVFRQAYRSANYSDVVTKTLKWEKASGRWLIVSETTAPIVAP